MIGGMRPASEKLDAFFPLGSICISTHPSTFERIRHIGQTAATPLVCCSECHRHTGQAPPCCLRNHSAPCRSHIANFRLSSQESQRLSNATQVLSLFDRVSVTAMLQLVREGLRAGTQQGKASQGKQPRSSTCGSSPDEDGDTFMGEAAALPGPYDRAMSEGAVAAALGILQGLAKVLRQIGLRDQPDLMRLVSETACQVACSPGLPGQAPLRLICPPTTVVQHMDSTRIHEI